ncbi:redoxin domain-containing protein [Oligoflexaceae bacterium]|nr:redoxin domain-containing protein [Oligoflexaceae bacterium]
MNSKLEAGQKFPEVKLKSLSSGEIELGSWQGNAQWQLVVVYRGKHCPLCTKYLKELKEMKDKFESLKLDIVIVSADPEAKAKAHTKDDLDLPFRTGIDLSIEQMKTLGLYISDPRSPKETDRPFAEPATFVIKKDQKLQIIDISNAPFARPDLTALYNGLKFISENDYPIRGTHA